MTDRILIIAAHPDDEALGCGGTIARHVAGGDEVHLLFVADGETARAMHAKPNRNYAADAAGRVLGVKTTAFLDLRDQMLDTKPLLEITQLIEAIVSRVQPTIVYTHHAGDLNRDHQIVHLAAMTALRPVPGSTCRAIYAFEVLSSTEWGTGFAPNHFVDISDGFMDLKLDALKCYDEEMRPPPHTRSYENVEALAEVRGASVGVPFAEAFVTMRSVSR